MIQVDLIIRNGLLYDGSGGTPYISDIAVADGRIVEIGPDLPSTAFSVSREIDADGFDVTPGFINIQSWAAHDLLSDPRALSDLAQGVTLEVFGEGWSEGPLSDLMKDYLKSTTGISDIPWSSLGEFLDMLAARGTAVNVASLVGAATLRYHAAGLSPSPCSPKELDHICGLLEESLQDGALGLGTALVYEPEFLYSTDDLIRMNRITASCEGLYAAHIRNESRGILEAVDEHIRITRLSGVRSMIYHFKVQGAANWHLQRQAIEYVEQARAAGSNVSACVYPYAAGSTGLSAALNPAWKTSGVGVWIDRLRSSPTRERILAEIRNPGEGWENFFLESGGGRGVLVTGIRNPAVSHLQGKFLSEIAEVLGVSEEEALIDLIIKNGDDVQAIFFHTSEDNLSRVLSNRWVSIGSDSGSSAPSSSEEGSDSGSAAGSDDIPHPRSYGSFARLFRKYVYESGLLSPEEAVRRVTALPAAQLNIDSHRGLLKPGYAADMVICRLSAMCDHADFHNSRVLSSGVRDVFVNGIPAFENGSATGLLPGRVVKRGG